MARLFDDAASDYAEYAAALFTATPFSIACWLRCDDLTSTQVLLGVADKDATNVYAYLEIAATSGVIGARSRSPSAGGVAVSSAGAGANAWHHACGVWTGGTLRAAFLDGGNKGTNTTSVSGPGAADVTNAGHVNLSSGRQLFFSGRLAELCIYNAALDDDEVAALAARVSPLKIRRANLAAYWPFLGLASPEPSFISNHPFTLSGPVLANHAPVAPPRRTIFVPSFAGLLGLTTFSGRNEDLHRVIDDAQAQYELYRGTAEAEPDFDAAAFETFTSLPHTTAALAYPAIYKFVLRQRNKYGLLSRNIRSWRLELDGSGNQVTTPPSDPFDETLEAAAAGKVRVTAQYDYTADGAATEADTFLVYLTTGGGNPDPSVDTPTEVTMVKADGIAHLDYTSGAYSNGTIVKALVRVRQQGTPDVDSTNVNNLGPVTASTAGPAAPEGAPFHGAVAEDVQ